MSSGSRLGWCYGDLGVAASLALVARVKERPDWMAEAIDGTSTADALLKKYCTWVYSKKGSYEKTAQILNIDRRTVKSKIDTDLL